MGDARERKSGPLGDMTVSVFKTTIGPFGLHPRLGEFKSGVDDGWLCRHFADFAEHTGLSPGEYLLVRTTKAGKLFGVSTFVLEKPRYRARWAEGDGPRQHLPHAEAVEAPDDRA